VLVRLFRLGRRCSSYLALLYLNSVLTQQVNGLSDIRLLITLVTKKEELHEASLLGQSAAPDVKMAVDAAATAEEKAAEEKVKSTWMTTEYLLDWLLKHGIAERLLGHENHSSILQRSAAVLTYLCRHSKLSTRHIDLLWEHTMDKHESILAIAYETLRTVSIALPQHLREYLFLKIRDLPSTRYDLGTLLMVFNFVTQNLKAAKEEAARVTTSDGQPAAKKAKTEDSPLEEYHGGQKLFWLLIQEDSKAAKDVQDRALLNLQYMLTFLHGQAYRETYASLCVQNLKDGKSVAPALTLLRFIIKSYPVEVKDAKSPLDQRETRSALIAALQSKHNILRLVLSDINRYKQQAKSDYAANAKEVASRLDFLRFIIQNSNSTLTLSRDDVDAIWKLTVEQALDNAERDVALTYAACSSPNAMLCLNRWMAFACPDSKGTATEPV